MNYTTPSSNSHNTIKKILLTLLSLFLLAIIILLLGAAMSDGSYQVTRSLHIQSSKEKIFPYIEDPKNWAQWSAWSSMDPEMKTTYSGSPKGNGAIMNWESSKSGNGSMTFSNANPDTGIMYDLTMQDRSFNAKGDIKMVSQDNGVLMTWSDTGKSEGLMNKVFTTWFVDSQLGGMFKTSLEKLKKESLNRPGLPMKISQTITQIVTIYNCFKIIYTFNSLSFLKYKNSFIYERCKKDIIMLGILRKAWLTILFLELFMEKCALDQIKKGS